MRNRNKYILAIVGTMIASALSATAANATPTITRTLTSGTTLYAMFCDSGTNNGQLASVNIQTGVETLIGTGTNSIWANSNSTQPGGTRGGCVMGATYNPVSHMSYWFNWDYAPSASGGRSSRLFSINVSTGESTPIGELTTGVPNSQGTDANSHILNTFGIATNQKGDMYALWANSSTTNFYVGLVNQSTGLLTNVHAIDSTYNTNFWIEGPYNFAFNPVDGKFYTAGQSYRASSSFTHLYSIDVTSGAVTDLGASGDSNATFNGFQFDTNGNIWGTNTPLQTATVSGWGTPGDLQQIPNLTPYYSEAMLLIPTGDDSAARAAAAAKAAADAAAAAKAKQDQDITAIVSSIVGAVGAITSGVVGLAATVEKNRRAPANASKRLVKKVKKKK